MGLVAYYGVLWLSVQYRLKIGYKLAAYNTV